MDLSKYSDVHTHNLNAGADAIINLPLDADVPSTGSYSVGVHPWNADDPIDWDSLAAKAASEQVVAIGEAGLDALRGPSLEKQEQVFVRHIELSESLRKPLIIHAVRTLQHIIELRKAMRPKQRWILHGFRGKPEMAQQLVRAGIDISLGKKYNSAVLDAVSAEHIFRETDDDWQ